jgi:hypothetical protein
LSWLKIESAGNRGMGIGIAIARSESAYFVRRSFARVEAKR